MRKSHSVSFSMESFYVTQASRRGVKLFMACSLCIHVASFLEGCIILAYLMPLLNTNNSKDCLQLDALAWATRAVLIPCISATYTVLTVTFSWQADPCIVRFCIYTALPCRHLECSAFDLPLVAHERILTSCVVIRTE